MRRVDEEATETEDTEDNTRDMETGLNGLVAASAAATEETEEADETEVVDKVPVTRKSRNRATTESREGDTDDESFALENNCDIKDGYKVETTKPQKRYAKLQGPNRQAGHIKD
jgi:hypothetical protein